MLKQQSSKITNNNKKNNENPFLVANPLYLDDEERYRDEIRKK